MEAIIVHAPTVCDCQMIDERAMTLMNAPTMNLFAEASNVETLTAASSACVAMAMRSMKMENVKRKVYVNKTMGDVRSKYQRVAGLLIIY
jgi:hypothetical protein